MSIEQELLSLRKARLLKKLRLFVSTDNPIWKRLAPLDAATGGVLAAKEKDRRPPSGAARASDGPNALLVSTCARLLGFSGEWRRQLLAGHIPDPQAQVQRIRSLLERLKTVEQQLRLDDRVPFHTITELMEAQPPIADFLASLDRADTVYAAGRALGLSVDECQKALDRIIYGQRPFLRGFDDSADGWQAADDAFYQLGGVYYAWLRRPDTALAEPGRSHLYLKCALRVRYVLDISGGYALRVKLNLPVIDPTSHDVQLARELHGELPLIEYDGFVHRRERCFWTLEERTQRADGDLITMITSKTRSRRGRLGGRYLTVGQEASSPIVNDAIVIDRIPEEVFAGADDEKRGQIMRSSVRVIRAGDDEFAGAEALFREQAAELGAA